MQLETEGHPLHTRSLTIVVEQAEAPGQLDVRGDIIDLRKCGFVPMSTELQPAGIIHLMNIQLEVELATRRIESLAVDQPVIAVNPSPGTGGECCRDPAPRLEALVGECMDDGFIKRLGDVFGGPLGCSHLLTLFQLMASAVPRACRLEEELQARTPSPRSPAERIFWRTVIVDGMERGEGGYALAGQMTDVLSRPGRLVSGPINRLARADEARFDTTLDNRTLALSAPHVGLRTRLSESIATSDWEDAGPRLAALAGAPMIPGMAKRLFSLLGDAPGDDLLLDLGLQLAPATIQIMAAITDRLITAAASVHDPGEPAAEDAPRPRPAPPSAGIGGMADSCYMWRSGGVLAAKRFNAGPLGDPRSE